MIGAGGFAVVSAAAAFAPSAEYLVAARALLGVFGAMLMPSTLSLIRNIFTDASARRLAIALWASCFTAGSALGPIVGGALLQHFHWGAVFLVAVPILLPLLVLAPRLVPESQDPNPGPARSVQRAADADDDAAARLGASSPPRTTAFSWLVVAALAVGIGSGGVRAAPTPQRHTDVGRRAVRQCTPFTSSILANFLSIVGLIGFIFFISQHLQLVLGLSPLAAGLVTLPGAVLSMIAGIAVVPVAKRIAPHALMIAGLVLVAAGFLAILLFRHDLTVVADHRLVHHPGDRRRHVADHLQRHHRGVGSGRQIRCRVGGFGDGLRAGRGRRHRDARHHLHGVLPRQRRAARRSHRRCRPRTPGRASAGPPRWRRPCRRP